MSSVKQKQKQKQKQKRREEKRREEKRREEKRRRRIECVIDSRCPTLSVPPSLGRAERSRSNLVPREIT